MAIKRQVKLKPGKKHPPEMARASLKVTEVEAPASPELTLDQLLTTLAKSRKGPMQVTIFRPHHLPHQPSGAAADGPGQDTTDQTIAGAGRRYAVGGDSFEGNSLTGRQDFASVPPKPVGEIPAMTEELVLAIEGLEKSVAILQDKLDPLLQPGAASTGGSNAAQTEPVGGTVLGERLRQAVAMVTALRRRVADITERTAL